MKALRTVFGHSFLMFGVSTRREADKEMVAEFNAPSETPLEEPLMEFTHAVDRSPEVTDHPP